MKQQKKQRAEVKDKIGELTALYETSLAINSELDWTQVLNMIMKKGIELTESQASTIAIFNEHLRRFEDIYTIGLSNHFVKNVAFRPGGLADSCLSEGKPILSNNINAKHRLSKLAREEGIKSFLCLPLIAKGKRLGVFYVYHHFLEIFSQDQINLLLSFANQAAIAIENARLYREIANTKDYLSYILEHSADMIITTQPDTKIIEFNKGAENILGYKKEEVMGISVEEFYVDRGERKGLMERVNREGSVSNYETRLRAKDGRIIDINLTLSQLKDKSGRVIGTVGISKDITEKKRLERELLQKNQELEDFVHTVSHDLQAPLRTIDGFSDILLEDCEDKLDKDGRHYLYRIKKSAEQMKALIEDLLEFSRLEKGSISYENIEVSIVIEEAKKELQHQLDKSKAELNIVGQLPVIYCDNARMVQVFINLISNSIKYVDTHNVPRVEIGYTDRGTFNEFYIKDNGIGINRKYHDKIFNIFQRLHLPEEYEGTGVGLTIAKKVIEMHKGKIWVESEEGKGSTFFFTIPKFISNE
jgi:PAS domain S-box-containing protein